MAKGKGFWNVTWKKFYSYPLGRYALFVVLAFCLIGTYAPLLASSKPLFVIYNNTVFFPLFRYLFYSGFYTKRLDLFFNLLMFALPLFVLTLIYLKNGLRTAGAGLIICLQFGLFLYIAFAIPKDPASDIELNAERYSALKHRPGPDWNLDLKYMNAYAKLNLLIRHRLLKEQNQSLLRYFPAYQAATQHAHLPTLWEQNRRHEEEQIAQLKTTLDSSDKHSKEHELAQANLNYLMDRQQWLETESEHLHAMVMPLLSHFHWEDDAGGGQAFNHFIPWWDLTRINRKDLLSALLFGTRISLTVGIVSVLLALIIGVPIGALAGYYAGTLDIFVCRLLEIWEAMPTFFMLLLAVGILQSKSIFLVISVIGLFGWTPFTRYIRGEFFKQRNLPYVEACRSLGFKDGYIIFKHILPNSLPPALTLMPFAVMAAITSEAGLSFLGLGEEGSCSWGVLMDEGRTVFPEESYLMWPPAILLTVLLIAIALVGDKLRDSLDPKTHRTT